MRERWPPGQRQLSDLLTGTVSPENSSPLDHVSRSRNLLLLCGLREVAEAEQAGAARTARLRDNYAALSAIESAYRQRSARLMAHPHVGAWLAMCLKHVKGREQGMASRPLWADLAHLGAITAAAAVMTGAETEATVPVHRGQIFIPTFGCIDVGSDSAWGLVTVQSLPDGALRLTDTGQIFAPAMLGGEDSGGLDLRHLSASCNGLAVDLELDDLDPYRDCHQLGAAGRLPPGEVESWRRMLAEAWEILAIRHYHAARSVARELVTLVPLLARGLSGISATSRHAPGAVTLTQPRDGTRLAATLVHELQHTRLGLALELIPLAGRPPGERLYSPWREDPRPLTGLIHGLHAATAAADFWRIEAQAGQAGPVAAFQYARVRNQMEIALDTLSRLGSLTGAGRILVEAVKDLAVSSARAPVSPRFSRLAEDVTLDHALRWRLLNLKPAERDVDRLAACWRAGTPGSPPSNVMTWSEGAESFTEDARLRLVHARLLGDSPGGPLSAGAASASAADVHLVSGEYQAAAAAYDHDIRTMPSSAEAWAGLAVASRGIADQAAVALSQRPELVRAVYGRLAGVPGAPSPLEVARWMSQWVTSPEG